MSYDSASKKATLNPDSNLEANTIYKATITTSVKETAGNALEQDYTWSFTTASPPVDACPYQPGDQPEGTVCEEGLVISPSSLVYPVPWTSDCRLYMVGNPFNQWAQLGDLQLHNYTGDVMWFGEASFSGPDAQYFYSASKDYITNNGPFGIASTEYVVDTVWMQLDPAVSNGTRTYRATLTYKDLSGNTLGSVALGITTDCKALNFP